MRAFMRGEGYFRHAFAAESTGNGLCGSVPATALCCLDPSRGLAGKRCHIAVFDKL